MRRSGKLAALSCLLALAALAVLGAAGAAAGEDDPAPKPPLYGGQTFQAIQGPDDPENYSWTVQLDSEQELVQVDDQLAVVVYKDSGEPPHTAFSIRAQPAHDSIGTAVPTTIAVSEGDVITLTVHHRAGNPAAGGAPFDYPITSGVGWEGGFHTYQVQMPPGEFRKSPAPNCVVPQLTGRSLGASRARLISAGCKLGAVRGKRGRGTKVVKQFRAPGTVLGAGAKVAIKLG